MENLVHNQMIWAEIFHIFIQARLSLYEETAKAGLEPMNVIFRRIVPRARQISDLWLTCSPRLFDGESRLVSDGWT